ncbi:MAG TPA: hypothetical protein VH352_10270, partial [Pseudonocardiaceae bacterium]|nr:hypothetical protein [Pseudonocardiaceae bacterium]
SHFPDFAIIAMVCGDLSRALRVGFADCLLRIATLDKPPQTMQALGIGKKRKDWALRAQKPQAPGLLGGFVC